jgi:hypothetical protein
MMASIAASSANMTAMDTDHISDRAGALRRMRVRFNAIFLLVIGNMTLSSALFPEPEILLNTSI